MSYVPLDPKFETDLFDCEVARGRSQKAVCHRGRMGLFDLGWTGRCCLHVGRDEWSGINGDG